MNKRETALLIFGFIALGSSLALCAWMSALTHPISTQAEELKVINRTWDPDNAFIVLSVKNTGISALSVSSVRVNDIIVAESNVAYGGDFTGTTHTLVPGAFGTMTITHAFASGIKYEFEVITVRGNKFTFVATAS